MATELTESIARIEAISHQIVDSSQRIETAVVSLCTYFGQMASTLTRLEQALAPKPPKPSENGVGHREAD